MTTIPQHELALQSAQIKRLGVAAFRREVAALPANQGARAVAAAIEHKHQDTIIGSARIGHLLRAIKWLGDQKCERCLIAAGVHNGDKRLRDLTERQIGAVVIQLEMWADRWSS